MNNFLKESFIDSNISNISCSILDVASSVVTGIPIPLATSLKQVYKFSIEIKERLFYSKLHEFLNEIKDIPQYKRVSFHDEISKKGDYVWEEMLVLIHDLDNTDKAKICACLLKNTVLGNLSYNDFKRLSYIVNSIYYEDLHSFICKKININDSNTNYKYVNLGLIVTYTVHGFSRSHELNKSLGIASSEVPTKEVKYRNSELGEMFIRYSK